METEEGIKTYYNLEFLLDGDPDGYWAWLATYPESYDPSKIVDDHLKIVRHKTEVYKPVDGDRQRECIYNLVFDSSEKGQRKTRILRTFQEGKQSDIDKFIAQNVRVVKHEEIRM